MIRIDSDWKFGLDQSEIELIRIDMDCKFGFGLVRIDVSELIGLNRIDFLSFFIKRDTKRFLDWFVIIRIASDTDIGMNRNSFDFKLSRRIFRIAYFKKMQKNIDFLKMTTGGKLLRL